MTMPAVMRQPTALTAERSAVSPPSSGRPQRRCPRRQVRARHRTTPQGGHGGGGGDGARQAGDGGEGVDDRHAQSATASTGKQRDWSEAGGWSCVRSEERAREGDGERGFYLGRI